MLQVVVSQLWEGERLESESILQGDLVLLEAIHIVQICTSDCVKIAQDRSLTRVSCKVCVCAPSHVIRALRSFCHASLVGNLKIDGACIRLNHEVYLVTRICRLGILLGRLTSLASRRNLRATRTSVLLGLCWSILLVVLLWYLKSVWLNHILYLIQ